MPCVVLEKKVFFLFINAKINGRRSRMVRMARVWRRKPTIGHELY